MSATIDAESFVDVRGKVCPADVARDVAGEVHRGLGDHLTCSRIELSDGGMALTEVQEAAIVANASQRFDGFEQFVRQVVVDEIESAPRIESAPKDALSRRLGTGETGGK